MFKSPQPLPSFGPNGSHWPHLLATPFPFDATIPNKISVDCNWGAIKSAISGVTQEQVNQGVVIFVAPGTLKGNGASSGSAAVLKDLGNPNWGKRITVCPRDGYGSVRVSNSMKCENVSNVCFAMFQIEPDFNFRGCRNSALAWSSYTEWLGGYGSSSYTTSNVEFTEVVREKSLVKDGDGFDVYTAGGRIEGWLFDGCYLAPNFRVAGSSSHADTFQFAATSGGSYANMSFKNCAVFSANNCSIQTGNIDGMVLDHCMIASSNKSLSRYPRLAGGDQGGVNAAFNGSGKNFKISNSYVFGSLTINTRDAPRVWLKVENTFSDRTYGGVNVPLEGSWLSTTENFDLDKRCPIPTQSYLKSIWSGGPVVERVASPEFSPQAGAYDLPLTVSISSATTGATILYSTDGSEPSVTYGGPLSITGATSIRAKGTKSGVEPSFVSSANYIKKEVPKDGEYFSNSAFTNLPFSGNKVTFKVTPLIDKVDGVIGLGSGTASNYADMAAIVQFFTDGQIHARNGAAYSPGFAPYVAGQTYSIEIELDLAAKTYSVGIDGVVQPERFAFRTEEAGITSADNLAFVSAAGSLKIFDIVGNVVDPAKVPTKVSGVSVNNWNLTWNPNPSAEKVSGYRVTETGNSGIPVFRHVTGNSLVLDGQFDVTVKVAAKNEAGYGPESETILVPKKVVAPDPRYINVTVERSTDGVAWTKFIEQKIAAEEGVTYRVNLS